MDLDDAVPGRRYMCIAYTCTTYALHHTQSDAKDAQLQSGTAVIMQGWSIAAPGLVARSETPGRASGESLLRIFPSPLPDAYTHIDICLPTALLRFLYMDTLYDISYTNI